jgi:hypothetical protein
MPQMRGVEERRYETYVFYDECLRDEDNKADGVLEWILFRPAICSG